MNQTMSVADPAFTPSDFIFEPDLLPAPPEVVMRVLEMLEDPEISISKLTHVIESDAGLSAKFFQMANSSLFSLALESTSLEKALLTIGLKSVRLVALASSIKSMIPPTEGMLASTELRRRSIMNALAARLFMEQDVNSVMLADEAFTAGLFTQIGGIVVATQSVEAYEIIIDEDSYIISKEAKEVLGFEVDALTSHLLSTWNIPTAIGDAIQLRHGIKCEFDATPTSKIAKGLVFGRLVEETMCRKDSSDAYVELLAFASEHMGADVEKLNDMLNELEAQMREMAEVFEFEMPSGVTLVSLLMKATHQMELDALASVADLARSQQAEEVLRVENLRLKEEAHKDSLTGLLNRCGFDEILPMEVKKCLGADGSGNLGLLIFDIDNFKDINDTYGHAAGDSVLRHIGEIMQALTRTSEYFMRIGGEEFALLMPNALHSDLFLAGERIRKQIEEAVVMTDEICLQVTISVGGASLRGEARTPSTQMYKEADTCLYEAKNSGRNKVVISD